MREQQKITIKIADVAPISLSVKPSEEEFVRDAERNVNRVWQVWSRQYSNKSSKEVLAMVAYQFARIYYQMLHTVDSEARILADYEKELDRLLDLTAGDDDSPASVPETDADKASPSHPAIR